MARGNQEQMHKAGYCKIENKMRIFVSSLSPKGNWICTICRYRCKDLMLGLLGQKGQNNAYKEAYKEAVRRSDSIMALRSK